jgi:hypothetical protein
MEIVTENDAENDAENDQQSTQSIRILENWLVSSLLIC